MRRRQRERGLTVMEKARKLLHALSSLFMFIYFIPEQYLFIRRDWFLLAPLGFFVAVELFRISKGWLFPGMREYERGQVSGYIWAGSTLVLAIILFPPRLVVPVYVCWAWLDPVCSILKRNPPWYPLLPFTLYVGLFLFLTAIPQQGNITAYGHLGDLAAAVLTASVALLMEYPNLRGYNDDFLMVMGPLVALSVFNDAAALLG